MALVHAGDICAHCGGNVMLMGLVVDGKPVDPIRCLQCGRAPGYRREPALEDKLRKARKRKNLRKKP